MVSTQYLRLDMDASGGQQFDPSRYIYPNADAEANIFMASFARHFTRVPGMTHRPPFPTRVGNRMVRRDRTEGRRQQGKGISEMGCREEA